MNNTKRFFNSTYYDYNMPSTKVHIAFSEQRTGKGFEELHKWIDQDEDGLGVNHRLKRHAYNTEEESQIYNHWERKEKGLGQKAVVEWLFHIAVDNLDTAHKKAFTTYGKEKAFNFFKFGLEPHSKFIYFDFDNLEPEDLEEEFSNVYEEY